MISPDFYPEQRPHGEDLFEREVTHLTQMTLASLVEEIALNGKQASDSYQPLTFQQSVVLEDRSDLYATRHFTADAEELPLGEKLIDIVIRRYRPIDIASRQKPAAIDYEYINYYFVNDGQDENGMPLYRVEKHCFWCRSDDLIYIIAGNHLTSDPEYVMDKAAGVNIVSEGEAVELINILAPYADQSVHTV
ncbi:MAG: hypothetical protein JWN33_110 [Candidatus Saccharibacteria bacterium]|nr:hypothetical protein [Candidatus Saccharibacteria bacterium]